ncbi:hypothetical protein ACJIZ3_019520 [Penstemon smallii]|uniref:Protein XRI1 n=1 Tax=Penstemon smallii TaxID=265156 RepID=A0ABD3T2V0_9LAMI
MSSQIYMESTDNGPATIFDEGDNYYDDFSTGYLEDVLFESFNSKRRRVLLFAQDNKDNNNIDHHHHLDNSIKKNCWTSNLIQNWCGNFENLSQITKSCDTNSDLLNSKIDEDEIFSKTLMYNDYSNWSPSNSCKLESTASTAHEWTTPDDDGTLISSDPIFSSGVNKKNRKKRVLTKVVYPFALVKPGGFEGDATLKDINERILMPPTRPVRHPVGDFACRPFERAAGLSGKAVVAFTRIHTQGRRGTITIIRTRG